MAVPTRSLFFMCCLIASNCALKNVSLSDDDHVMEHPMEVYPPDSKLESTPDIETLPSIQDLLSQDTPLGRSPTTEASIVEIRQCKLDQVIAALLYCGAYDKLQGRPCPQSSKRVYVFVWGGCVLEYRDAFLIEAMPPIKVHKLNRLFPGWQYGDVTGALQYKGHVYLFKLDTAMEFKAPQTKALREWRPWTSHFYCDSWYNGYEEVTGAFDPVVTLSLPGNHYLMIGSKPIDRCTSSDAHYSSPLVFEQVDRCLGDRPGPTLEVSYAEPVSQYIMFEPGSSRFKLCFDENLNIHSSHLYFTLNTNVTALYNRSYYIREP